MTSYDKELALLRKVTLSLPQMRGSGVIVNRLIKPLYCRKTRPPVWAEVNGLQMLLDPQECVDSGLLFMPHLYDRDELNYLKENLKPGGVFVDVGANIGVYTLIASQAVGSSGTVLSIEADPSNFKKLQENVAKNNCTSVTPVNVGVSDKVEMLALHLNNSGNCGGHSFASTSRNGETVNVDCKPLLEVLTDRSIEKINGMKLDIEGFETRVLQAFFREADRSIYPDFVVIEVNPEYSNETSPIDILDQHGYRKVVDCGLNAILELG